MMKHPEFDQMVALMNSVTRRWCGSKLLQSPICCAPPAVSSSSWDEWIFRKSRIA